MITRLAFFLQNNLKQRHYQKSSNRGEKLQKLWIVSFFAKHKI